LIPRLIQRAKSGRLWRVGDGTNLVSTAYVENVADAHLQAADALDFTSPVAGQAYFVNEPEPVRLWGWVDELLALAGLPPVRRRVSAKVAYHLGAEIESVYRLLRLRGEPPMTRFLAAQLASSHYYSIAKARRDFGYAPRVPVAEGMRRLFGG
jgi:nucleoside-diphosphate-sugar epimerase